MRHSCHYPRSGTTGLGAPNPGIKQRGAVLIVSLILLLVMTLISIAAIDSATFESQMVRASEWKERVYQTAMSNIRGQMTTYKSKINDLLTVMTSGAPLTFTAANFAYTDPDYPALVSQSGELRYVKTGIAEGGGSGTSKGMCSVSLCDAHSFELDSEARSRTGSRSDQTQGFDYLAPKTK